MDYKVVMYNKCKEDNKCNNDECNESNENQQLIFLMMSSDAEDVLTQTVWRKNIRNMGPQVSANV